MLSLQQPGGARRALLGEAPAYPRYADIDGLVLDGDPEDPSEVQAVAAWLRGQYDLLPDFGWLDGGCLVLALAARSLGTRHGMPVQLCVFRRMGGDPDHFLVRMPSGRYFDGDGFATADEVVDKMLGWERVRGYVEDLDQPELDRILAEGVFWHSRSSISELCDRMDKAFGRRLLDC